MTLFGNGRAALADDPRTADSLGWPRRRRGLPDPLFILQARAGDPLREPWIVPAWMEPGHGVEVLWRRRARSGQWTYLNDVPGVRRYLRELDRPDRSGGVRVGIAGLGRVGGTAAAALASLPVARSGVAELLICDADAANEKRWLRELEAIEPWRPRRVGPGVQALSPARLFHECDVFIFCAAVEVPGLGSLEDVRLAQLSPNRRALATYLEAAAAADFAGLFLIVSDPVECLAQAAFRDSNVDADGTFDGRGLAPERIAGLALGVMWARAVARARREGWFEDVVRRGAAYGPHSADVAVFDDLAHPDPRRSKVLSDAAGKGNLDVRGIGFLPYIGPAFSSVALALPGLLRGSEVLASPFVDGIYFGAPVRRQGGIYPSPRRLGAEARRSLRQLHAALRTRVEVLGLGF